MIYTQEGRLITLATPLGEDVLLLQGFSGFEAVSRPFAYQLDLLSTDSNLDPKKIIGQRATITISLGDSEKPRFINGVINRFSQSEQDATFTRYRAELVPWLWLLTRTADCRIFQKMSVTEIIEQVFTDLGLKDFKKKATGSYEKLEYCVQYRETDFNFVSRLMEQYGLFYYFEHEDKKHTLVYGDSPDAIQPNKLQKKVRCELSGGLQDEDHITSWHSEQEFRPGRYAVADFNFETPTTSLHAGVDSTIPVGGNKSFEIFDYPGEYLTKNAGTDLAKLRMEEEEVAYLTLRGASNCRAFATGTSFELTEHYRRDMNKSYLLTEVRHAASVGSAYATGPGVSTEEVYSNHFVCIPATVPFRAARITPKPFVQGVQTAIVVGPKGEEIFTDKYGRVKVQFHWDRAGKYDDKSSCWIRVAQNWAGKRWGAVFLPRIGQEVIVDFLEGDPDQPIIVGSVYNGQQMPPYALPDEKTKSAIKSYSSKGGGGFNEIRFEDKKGSEQVFIHAEKNQDVRVKNDSLEWIGNERHLIVKKDQLEQVDGDKHLTIKGDQNEKIDGTVSLNAGSDLQQKVGMKHALDAGQEIHLKAGMNIVIEAGMTITLKAGSSSINITPGGIQIIGQPMVMINSGGSPQSGSGCSPEAAKPPKEADKAEKGEEGEVPPPPKPKKRTPVSPQALALKQAAKSGVPFCEKCAEAARQRALAAGASEEEAEEAAQEAGIAGGQAMAEEGGDTTRAAAPGEDSATDAATPGQGGDTADAAAPGERVGDASMFGQPVAETGEKTFVAIELVDQDGRPVANQRYKITLPDGSEQEGNLDAAGKARINSIDPGTCKVTFPDLDGNEWEPA